MSRLVKIIYIYTYVSNVQKIFLIGIFALSRNLVLLLLDK